MSFQTMHPIVLFVYFAEIIGLTMVTREPIFLLASFICSIGIQVYLYKREVMDVSISRNQGFAMLGVILIGGILNAATYHDGVSIWLYVNDTPITGEAFLYGCTVGLMIVCVISWFSLVQKMIDQEAFLYLFGKVSPTLALIISMIFRFIPLLKMRYDQIHMANQAMGAYQNGRVDYKMKNRIHEVNVLISWSLEQSIESAKNMEARGYGLKNRSSFHRFVFTKRDGIRLGIEIVFLSILIECALLGGTKVFFYPRYEYKEDLMIRLGTLVAFVGMVIWPVCGDFTRGNHNDSI